MKSEIFGDVSSVHYIRAICSGGDVSRETYGRNDDDGDLRQENERPGGVTGPHSSVIAWFLKPNSPTIGAKVERVLILTPHPSAKVHFAPNGGASNALST